jgi:hypothetical protein
MVKVIHLYCRKGFALREDDDKLKVLDPLVKPLKWRDLVVKEKKENMKKRAAWFDKLEPGSTTYSKIVQVNATDVYIIGGDEMYKSLLARDYNVPRGCLKVNISTAEVA